MKVGSGWSVGRLLLVGGIVGMSGAANGQLSLSSVAGLAVRNSPRVKMAQDEVQRAAAAVGETKDSYIPNLSLGGGLGRSYGITLTVPTIFTVNSQSLVYSPSQRDYIRAAKSTLEASQYALREAQQEVEEDAAVTCVSVEAARSRVAVLAEQEEFAQRLLTTTKQRLDAGVDSELEWKRTRRALLAVQVVQPTAEAELAALEEHLAALTGVPGAAGSFDVKTIPQDSSFAGPGEAPGAPSLVMLSSEANTRAKEQLAHGDTRSRYFPQVLMQSQYGRISPINDVSSYYNLNGRYNVAEFGVAIQFSLFDKVRSARARETDAVARHMQEETEQLRDQQEEDRIRGENSLDELAKKLELAELDRDIATDQLAVMLKEVSTDSADVAGRQMTPKDEMYARIDERQHYLDWIAARLDLQRAQIAALRQKGRLDSWLSSGVSGGAGAPAP